MANNKNERQLKRENMMLNEPLPRVILTMAYPTIIAFLINSIYSMADIYFVSSLGTNATAAVSAIFCGWGSGRVSAALHPPLNSSSMASGV